MRRSANHTAPTAVDAGIPASPPSPAYLKHVSELGRILDEMERKRRSSGARALVLMGIGPLIIGWTHLHFGRVPSAEAAWVLFGEVLGALLLIGTGAGLLLIRRLRG